MNENPEILVKSTIHTFFKDIHKRKDDRVTIKAVFITKCEQKNLVLIPWSGIMCLIKTPVGERGEH